MCPQSNVGEHYGNPAFEIGIPIFSATVACAMAASLSENKFKPDLRKENYIHYDRLIKRWNHSKSVSNDRLFTLIFI
jgi:hypothetical protein